MQGPLFLLVLMVITALGVRLFLAQLHGTPLRLPGFKLPFPPLRRRQRHRTAATRRPREASADPVDQEAGVFAVSRSPFASAPGSRLPPASMPVLPIIEDDDEDYEDEDEEYLPSNQVDFFAGDSPERQSSPREPASVVTSEAPSGQVASGLEAVETPNLDTGGVEAASQAPEVFAVPASEPDPGDIMSFFEKAGASATKVPETLRGSVESVTATDLLSEARELRALLHRD